MASNSHWRNHRLRGEISEVRNTTKESKERVGSEHMRSIHDRIEKNREDCHKMTHSSGNLNEDKDMHEWEDTEEAEEKLMERVGEDRLTNNPGIF
jgi:hypothetical protein